MSEGRDWPMSAAQNAYFFGFVSNPILNDIPPYDAWETWARPMCNGAFVAGARWATRQESRLSPHVARFIEMMILLGYLDDGSPTLTSYEMEVPY